MGSCTYGAAVGVGEPDWYAVTKADIDTWFSGFPYLFLLWVYGWVGRSYSLPLLALLNPDVPAAMGWQTLITQSLVTGRFGAVGTLADAMDLLIQYHVFKDHCTCLGSVPGTCPGYPMTASPRSQAGGGAMIFDQVHIPSGSTHLNHAISNVLTGDAAGTKWTIWFGNPGTPYSNRFSDISGLLNGVSNSNSSVIPGGYTLWSFSASDQNGNAGYPWGGDISVSLIGCVVGAGPPAAPGTITTTGIPTVTAPSGTTSDQIMTQLLVQQFEIRQLADLVRSGPIGGSGLLPTPGTVHAGVSGDGEFACVALQGIRVQLSGVPTSVDRWIAHPDEYSGAGQVSFQGPAGWTDNLNAAHIDQYIPCPVPASTKVGYHFLGGITATITEYPS